MVEKNEQSGVVIILAVLIMGTVMATAIALGNVIIRDIMQSRLINQSMQAYYYAESGSERALYQIRQREGIVDCNLLGSAGSCDGNGFCSNNTSIPCVNLNGGGLGSWTINAQPEMETIFTLTEGETFQVDLFDSAQTDNSGINQIGINFSNSSAAMLGELTNVTNVLRISGASICLDQPPILKGFITNPCLSEAECPALLLNGLSNALSGGAILSQCSYIFKLNYPLNTDGTLDSTQVAITAYDQDTDPKTQKPIPSRLIIDSGATFGDSAQTVRVRTPIRPPLSGLYDFVLFSDSDIIK